MSPYDRIYALVRRIPPGRVASYGQIAGYLPGVTARMVGYAMAALSDGGDVPWHRVINSRGEISARPGGGPAEQQRLLDQEGVAFDRRGRVDFSAVRWQGPDLDWLVDHGLSLEDALAMRER